jgi:hypothetical protein
VEGSANDTESEELMGTWGNGPFDNDDASDVITRLMKPVHIVETRKSNHSASYHYNEARAVVQLLLLSHGTDILGGPSLLHAVKVLARIRSDVVWIADFRSPAAIMARLDQELDAILHRMRQCKGCKEHRQEAQQIADDARKVKLVDVERELAKRPPRPKRQNRATYLAKRRKRSK